MKKWVQILKALADPNRLRMALLLRYRPLCVCEFDALLDIAYPTISANLKIMTSAGLIEFAKEGKWVVYRLVSDKAIHSFLSDLFKAIEDKTVFQQDMVQLEKLTREGCFFEKNTREKKAKISNE